MSKKYKIIITSLIAVLVVMATCFCISKYKHSHPVYSVSSINNVIEVVGNKADKNLNGPCYITVEKDEKIVVTSSIKSGAIDLKLKLFEIDIGIEEKFVGEGTYEYEAVPGEYAGFASVAEDRTTGYIIVKVVPKDA